MSESRRNLDKPEFIFNVAARFIKTVKAAAHSDFVLVQSRTNSVVRHPSVLMLGLICYNSYVLANSANDNEGDVHLSFPKAVHSSVTSFLAGNLKENGTFH